MERTANEIMSKNLSMVNLKDSVRKAYQMMKEKSIRHLPVLDENKQLIGILTDRDLNRAMKPTTLDNLENAEFDPNHEVKDFMSWPVRTINSDVEIQEAAELMLKEKISALLVIDQDNGARGIITTDDMLELLISLLDNEGRGIKTTIESVMKDYIFYPGM